MLVPQGYLARQKLQPPLGSWAESSCRVLEVAISYERGTPAALSWSMCLPKSGEPRRYPAPKLTNVYRGCRVSTLVLPGFDQNGCYNGLVPSRVLSKAGTWLRKGRDLVDFDRDEVQQDEAVHQVLEDQVRNLLTRLSNQVRNLLIR